MIFDSTDPTESRSNFKNRAINNKVVIGIAFVITVTFWSSATASLSPGSFGVMLIGNFVALSAAYYLYLHWHDRAIRIKCRHCNKIILSTTPWFCTVCRKENLNPASFPFIDKCEHCGTEPKAYRCHHCPEGNLIFLSDDEDATNFAHRLNSAEDKPMPDKHDEEIKNIRKNKDIAVEKCDLAEAKRKLNSARARTRAERVSKQTPKEKLWSKVDSRMEIENAAKELRSKIDEEFKNDEKERRRWRAALAEAAREQKLEEM